MYNPEIHHRHSIRLKEYDYSQNGMYFVTICTQDKKKILSDIISNENIVGAGPVSAQNEINAKFVGAHDCAQKNNNIKLTTIGNIVEQQIKETNTINKNIKIYDYVIMPNHIHMIIDINDEEYIKSRAQSCAPTIYRKTIGEVIRGIKSSISNKLGYSIWQRNYYEHVIRNEKDYLRILEYIQNNPLNWVYDKYYI